MPIDANAFTLHDMRDFPIVLWNVDALQPGYAAQWVAEMDALIKEDLPFVLIFGGTPSEEAHEDRKTRGIWLKKNKGVLARLCLSMVGIEPNAVKRAALRLQSAMASKAFGVQADVMASDDEARALARTLLAKS